MGFDDVPNRGLGRSTRFCRDAILASHIIVLRRKCCVSTIRSGILTELFVINGDFFVGTYISCGEVFVIVVAVGIGLI